MHLAGDFDEAEGGVEVVADGVLGESFNLGVRETGGAEMIDGMLDERSAEALVAMGGGDSEIWNVANSGRAVLPGGDIADDLAIVFGHEDTGGIAGDIVVDVPRFAPFPIMAIDQAKMLFDAVVDGNAGKALDGEALEVLKVGRLVKAYSHPLILDFGF
jgi:hypothetical protein